MSDCGRYLLPTGPKHRDHALSLIVSQHFFNFFTVKSSRALPQEFTRQHTCIKQMRMDMVRSVASVSNIQEYCCSGGKGWSI